MEPFLAEGDGLGIQRAGGIKTKRDNVKRPSLLLITLLGTKTSVPWLIHRFLPSHESQMGVPTATKDFNSRWQPL